MRGVMIWAGVELINRFEWLLYGFGAFLFFSGLKMMFKREGNEDPEKSLVVRAARKILPIAKEFNGQHFTTRVDGRRIFTPLFLVLLAVETTDLLFAVDSIPAIFGVTRQSFIVFTSNIFAILGLRSLYFLLAGAMGLFRYLKFGLATVLVFIGVKMLIDPHETYPWKWYQYDIPDMGALLVVVIIIALSILASMIATKIEPAKSGGAPPKP
jgi:tellurite resistance protein TerC